MDEDERKTGTAGTVVLADEDTEQEVYRKPPGKRIATVEVKWEPRGQLKPHSYTIDDE